MSLLNLELNWWNVWQARIRDTKRCEHGIVKEAYGLSAAIAQMNYVCYQAQYKRGMK